MPKPLKILTVPSDEIELRSKSRKLTEQEIHSEEIQELIASLYLTLNNSKDQVGWEGAGLAAVQVGEPVQIFLAWDVNADEIVTYINPEVTLLGEKTDVREEGCLSIPTFTGDVERNKRIRITYTDRDGEKHTEKFSGYSARIIQHENDHLHGILFTDILVL